MGVQGRKTYNYYAFISYSRKDEAWAKWLQKKLETYRIPAILRKQNLNVPQKLYPVFRDKTDLTGGKLLEVLHEELDNSQYLIVICSPNSAGSEWVDKEIRHFMEKGREEYIIPFIVGGEPMAGNDAQECYPESLRRGTEAEILGISVKELGKEKAFLRVVATLLNLKFDQIVMRDRRRRVRQRVLAAAGCLLLLAGLLAGAWYYMPHSGYYRDFVCCYEVPQGLYPLSRKERMGRAEYYRIVTKEGKVVRLERLNSLGKPVQPIAAASEEAYASIDFFYEGKQLSRAELRDGAGCLILVRDYSSNLKAVDFLKSDDSSQAFALSAVQGGYGLEADNISGISRSEITRCINTYDENGYLVEELFMRDNRNTPVADNNGNYGFRYERESSGLVRKVIGLDENGNPHNCRYGYAMYVYSYDDKGQNIARECFNSDGEKVKNEAGYFRAEVLYDSMGNLVCQKFLDERNVPCNIKNGYAQIEIQYTEQGFKNRVQWMDADGKPVCSKKEGIHGFQCSYDRQGNMSSIEYFDNEMQPAYINDGYAKMEYVYDDNGRVKEAYYLGKDEEPVCEKNSGCAGVMCQWDENGKEIADTYVDAQNRPAISRYGYASVKMEYDAAGNLIKQSYYDADGKAMRIKENYASVEYGYDGVGNLVKTTYKDESGKPCMITGGCAESEYEYDERGNRVSEKYYDEGGNPVIISEGYHECRMAYDGQGNCIRIEYYDEDGKLHMNSEAYAYIEYLYDEYGNVVESSIYDEYGQPRQKREGSRICWEYDIRGNVVKEARYPWFTEEEDEDLFTIVIVYEYDDKDNLIKTSYFDVNGQPDTDEGGVSVYLYTYDERNRTTGVEVWYRDGKAGRKVEYEYDERNQLARECYYTLEKGKGEKMENQIWCFYDDFGNNIRREWRNPEGGLMIGVDNCAYAENKYTMAGDCFETAYYDAEGKLCMHSGGYARLKTDFDSLGNIVRQMYYDQDDILFKVMEYEYNSQGWMLSSLRMDGNGNLLDGEDGTCRMEYRYDKSGRETECVAYNAEGKELAQTGELVVLYYIEEGSPAALAGIQKEDYLLKYDSWELFNYENIIAAGDMLTPVIQQGLEKEKEVVVGRIREEGTEGTIWDFYVFSFGPGVVGIRMWDVECQAEEVENIRRQYEMWESSNDA